MDNGVSVFTIQILLFAVLAACLVALGTKPRQNIAPHRLYSSSCTSSAPYDIMCFSGGGCTSQMQSLALLLALKRTYGSLAGAISSARVLSGTSGGTWALTLLGWHSGIQEVFESSTDSKKVFVELFKKNYSDAFKREFRQTFQTQSPLLRRILDVLGDSTLGMMLHGVSNFVGHSWYDVTSQLVLQGVDATAKLDSRPDNPALKNAIFCFHAVIVCNAFLNPAKYPIDHLDNNKEALKLSLSEVNAAPELADANAFIHSSMSVPGSFIPLALSSDPNNIPLIMCDIRDATVTYHAVSAHGSYETPIFSIEENLPRELTSGFAFRNLPVVTASAASSAAASGVHSDAMKTLVPRMIPFRWNFIDWLAGVLKNLSLTMTLYEDVKDTQRCASDADCMSDGSSSSECACVSSERCPDSYVMQRRYGCVYSSSKRQCVCESSEPPTMVNSFAGERGNFTPRILANWKSSTPLNYDRLANVLKIGDGGNLDNSGVAAAVYAWQRAKRGASPGIIRRILLSDKCGDLKVVKIKLPREKLGLVTTAPLVKGSNTPFLFGCVGDDLKHTSDATFLKYGSSCFSCKIFELMEASGAVSDLNVKSFKCGSNIHKIATQSFWNLKTIDNLWYGIAGGDIVERLDVVYQVGPTKIFPAGGAAEVYIDNLGQVMWDHCSALLDEENNLLGKLLE